MNETKWTDYFERQARDSRYKDCPPKTKEEIKWRQDLKKMYNEFFRKNYTSAKQVNTRKSYTSSINRFFRAINQNPLTYFKNGRKKTDVQRDLRLGFERLEKNTPLTQKLTMSRVKIFMVAQDRKLEKLEDWKKIKNQLKGARRASEDLVPTAIQIKKVLINGNVTSRGLFTIMACTGCRIGELTHMKIDDVYRNETPVRIHLRPEITKTSTGRDIFLTSEAANALEEWLKIRKEYLIRAIKKSKYAKDDKDTRVFPMTNDNCRTIWENLVKKTDLYKIDSRTNRVTLHPHCLRRFFRTYLGHADLAEEIMGHASLYGYRDFNLTELAKLFLEYSKNVTIFAEVDKEQLDDIQTKMTDMQEENQKLQKDVNDLRMELLEVKLRRVEETKKDQE